MLNILEDPARKKVQMESLSGGNRPLQRLPAAGEYKRHGGRVRAEGEPTFFSTTGGPKL